MGLIDFCKREAVCAYKDESVLEAAKRMRQHCVGDLVVVISANERRVPIGIITDRDLATEVMARGLDPRALTVGEIMTHNVVTASPHDRIGDAAQLMLTKNVRCLPVVDGKGYLTGIVSIDDIYGSLTRYATDH